LSDLLTSVISRSGHFKILTVEEVERVLAFWRLKAR